MKRSVKLFFCKCGKKEGWKLFLTTETKLNFMLAYEIYAMRWSIEIFCSDSKRLLGLVDCSSRDFFWLMSHAIHITTLKCILQFPEPVDLKLWMRSDEIQCWHHCISLRYDFYKGTRRMKLLDSNEIRQLWDVCVFEINGMEVFLWFFDIWYQNGCQIRNVSLTLHHNQ